MAAPIELPSDIRLEYLAEGAANIVYRILPHAVFSSHQNGTTLAANTADLHSLPSENSLTTPPPTEIEPSPSIPTATSQDLSNKLLRLHKTVPWIPSYSDLYDVYTNKIAPLFDPTHLISQTLILLPPHLIFSCNAALRTAESSSWLSQPHTTDSTQVIHSLLRPTPRHGTYLDTSDLYGLLIEDMSPHLGNDELLLELKPKWLAQSPTAPATSARCRTCALRAMRDANHTNTNNQDKTNTHAHSVAGRAGKKAAFCPLDLVSVNRTYVDAAVARVLEAQLVASHELQLRDETIFNGLKRNIADWMVKSPLLHRLRDLQVRLDPKGVLGLDLGMGANLNPGLDFLLATTLRDCTLFLRVRFLTPEPPPGHRQISGERMAVLGEGRGADEFGGLIDGGECSDSDQEVDGSESDADGSGSDSDGSEFEIDGTSRLRRSEGQQRGGIQPRSARQVDGEAVIGERIPDTGLGLHITAKLGDLDLKEAEGGKVAYWRDLERNLIEGGWYEGRDEAVVVGCALERGLSCDGIMGGTR